MTSGTPSSPQVDPAAGGVRETPPPASVNTPPAPKIILNPEQQKHVTSAREVCLELMKAIKSIGFYRHNVAAYREYLTRAHQMLTRHLDTYKNLTLRCEVTNMTMFKQEIFPDDTPIPYKFFKDGIRQIIFRAGFSIDELLTFTNIALSDPDRGAEDLNAQFWRSQLPNFEYIMMDGFRMDEFTEEEIEVEVAVIVDYLQKRLRGTGNDSINFAHLTAEDLEVKFEDVEQVRGVVITGLTATVELKAQMQKEIEEEETRRLFPKIIAAIFHVLESGVQDITAISDMLTQLLDAMLLEENITAIYQIAAKLKSMAQNHEPSGPVPQLTAAFLGRMAEEQRIQKIGELLRERYKQHKDGCINYLGCLEPAAAPLIIAVLETLETTEARKSIIQVLIPLARANPELFGEKLRTTERPQTQRDMLEVINAANIPGKLRLLVHLLKSRNLVLRLDVMQSIALIGTQEARKTIVPMLDDAQPQVRQHAAQLLPEFNREQAFSDLKRIILAKDFESRSDEEREAFFGAMGSTAVPGVYAFFNNILQAKSGFFTLNRSKVINQKLQAISGLSKAGTIQAVKLLNDVIEDKSQPDEVVESAKLRLAELRSSLFGEKPPKGAPS